MIKTIRRTVEEEKAGERLDSFLSGTGEEALSRSRAARLIRDGAVSVGGKVCDKPSEKLKAGDLVEVTLPEIRESAVEAQDLPVEILYQDRDLAVIVKPCGMVVHPAAGNPDGTLVNALLFHLDHLSGIGGEMRPGIVHRLDKDTSGIMLVAKTDLAHRSLAAQLAARTIEKHYHALVYGRMKEPSGRIDCPIGRSRTDRKKMAVDPAGRQAVTEWKVLEERAGCTLLDVHILTGRTHQIRVHMSHIGHPVLGDVIYGKAQAKKADRLMLHACSIRFDHPVTGERMHFESPCPFDPCPTEDKKNE